MPAQSYLDAASAALEKIRATQLPVIDKAATLLAQAIIDGHTIFSFGCSHSFILTEELVYRTGGLMLVNPIMPHGMDLSVRPMSMTSQFERLEGLGNILLRNSGAAEGDVLLVASTSGRNAVANDIAIEARAHGVKVIAITAMEYTTSVTSRHSSGKMLYEFADLVLDNCAPVGDAAVSFEEFPQSAGPLSTLTGVAVVNSLMCATIQKLLDAGLTPPVYISANLDGGDEHNAKTMAEYKDRIHY